LQQTGSATGSGESRQGESRQIESRQIESRQIEVYEYPDSSGAPPLPSWEGWAEEAPGEPAAVDLNHDPASTAMDAGARAEFEQTLAVEVRRSFDAGREQGRAEGRKAEHDAQAPAQAAAEELRVRQAAELLQSFTEERDRYLHLVEREVVELALAVAARILRREAQMDPLLLTGAVRVALGQLSASTQVRLRVPPAELDLWTETIALLPKVSVKPTVVSGEGMRLGDCLIETDLGTVDLGIRSQLGEIERGFFDRAGGHRTGAAQHEDANESIGAVHEVRV
jgi:flagellar assembly protein FliH